VVRLEPQLSKISLVALTARDLDDLLLFQQQQVIKIY
jgi:hypothetical protein